MDILADENEIKTLWEGGKLPWLTHLMGGNEEWLTRYFTKHYAEDDWVFCSHRCHFHYTLSGHTDLVEQVKKGKSMFLYGPRFVCSAIVAGVCSMACGRALGMKLTGDEGHVHCFVGDGATDEGSFWEALRFAEGRNLPITFIVEDNGGQCGVSYQERWGESSLEDELSRYRKVRYYKYTPKYPHAGTLDEKGNPTRPRITL